MYCKIIRDYRCFLLEINYWLIRHGLVGILTRITDLFPYKTYPITGNAYDERILVYRLSYVWNNNNKKENEESNLIIVLQ